MVTIKTQISSTRDSAIAERPAWCSMSVETLSTAVQVTQTDRMSAYGALSATATFIRLPASWQEAQLLHMRVTLTAHGGTFTSLWLNSTELN